MIRVFKSGEVARADILYRGESGSTQAVEDAVADILADVKKNGDAAVLRYCEKFDGVKLAGRISTRPTKRRTRNSSGR